MGRIFSSLQGALKEIPDFPRFRIFEAKLKRTLRVWSEVFDLAGGVKPPSLVSMAYVKWG